MRKRNGHDQRRGNRDNGHLTNARYIGSGVTRDAFSCRASSGCVAGYTEGSYLVFKKFKSEYAARGYSVSPNDATMQQYCKTLAEEFNALTNTVKNGLRCPVVIRDAAYKYFTDTGPVLLERQVHGTWTRFTSNSGWAGDCDPIIDFFSHWTYKHTGCSLVVTDLQGHRGEPGGPKYLKYQYYYMLSDPCINSATRQYGINDLGGEGIDMFFRHHTCNMYCHAHGLHDFRPWLQFRPPLQMIQSTSYSLDNLQSRAGRIPPHVPQLEAFSDCDDDDSDE